MIMTGQSPLPMRYNRTPPKSGSAVAGNNTAVMPQKRQRTGQGSSAISPREAWLDIEGPTYGFCQWARESFPPRGKNMKKLRSWPKDAFKGCDQPVEYTVQKKPVTDKEKQGSFQLQAKKPPKVENSVEADVLVLRKESLAYLLHIPPIVY